MTRLLQFVSPETNHEILDELDRALTDHMLWLQRWHRALLCQQPLDDADLGEDGHRVCGFGAWYQRNRNHGLINQRAFRALGQSHEDMHRLAYRLGLQAKAGEPVDSAAYDALMASVNAFNAQIRRLERAFRKAFSDLDPLTGIYNRHAMLAELHTERERSARTGQPCTLALADIDFFKVINDTHGHLVGDQALFAAAQTFSSHLRPFDLLFRYGGEEFLFCLPSADSITAGQIAERLRRELARTRIPLDNPPDGAEPFLSITASFGMAEMTAELSTEEVVARADRALYAAKHAGRNRVRLWSSDLDRPATEGQP